MDIRDLERRHVLSVEVDDKDPPTVVRSAEGQGPQITLDWDQAMDDERHLRKCPVCSCRELFVRRDFPQVTGFVVVLLAGVVAVVLFAQGQELTSISVLGIVALLDLVIYFFTGQCLVCYRCRSEFRGVPIGPEHKPWELAIGEKYRRPAETARSSSQDPPAVA